MPQKRLPRSSTIVSVGGHATKAINQDHYDLVLSVVYATKATAKIIYRIALGRIAASRSVAKDAPLRRTVQRTGTIVATQTGASRPSCCESASTLAMSSLKTTFSTAMNIAARLEPLAEPGGICVSSIVHRASAIGSTLASGVAVTYRPADPSLKWHRQTDVAGNGHATNPGLGPRRIDRLLPFTNMSGDPEQGISPTVITDLSKIAGLL
jgi:hypothetical protein